MCLCAFMDRRTTFTCSSVISSWYSCLICAFVSCPLSLSLSLSLSLCIRPKLSSSSSLCSYNKSNCICLICMDPCASSSLPDGVPHSFGCLLRLMGYRLTSPPCVFSASLSPSLPHTRLLIPCSLHCLFSCLHCSLYHTDLTSVKHTCRITNGPNQTTIHNYISMTATHISP